MKMIPKHTAIIMDGNGRWAKNLNKSRRYGHQQGASSAKNIVKEASSIGVKYLTLYAFSTENWKKHHRICHRHFKPEDISLQNGRFTLKNGKTSYIS